MLEIRFNHDLNLQLSNINREISAVKSRENYDPTCDLLPLIRQKVALEMDLKELALKSQLSRDLKTSKVGYSGIKDVAGGSTQHLKQRVIVEIDRSAIEDFTKP